MTLLRMATRGASLALIATLAIPSTVAAQLSTNSSSTDDSVERLGRFIRILSGAPRDLTALLGAGRAALDVGDANAALGFFARAEEVAPTSGAAKAGLGSSLVMIEKPDDALRLFAQAVSMGVPEAAIARDRGLAYDLRGDNRRAQRDYALALTQGRDDELIRRYALSLGISGDRQAALDMLDPLLRRQDQGAWRARAFIMAMNGDVTGANGVARQLMVPAMADAMVPLLSRLATLNPAERAHAVNFGTVPADGTRLAMQTGDPYAAARTASSLPSSSSPASPAAGSGLIPSGDPLGPRQEGVTPARKVEPESAAPRRRPGAPVTDARVAVVDRAVPKVAANSTPTPTSVVRIAEKQGPLADGTPAAPASVSPAPAPDRPASTVAAAPVAASPAAPVALPRTSPPAPASRLAGLLAGLETERETAVELPTARELRLARAAAKKKMAELAAQAAAERAAKEAAAAEALAAKRFPARTWVQVATGRNDAGLGPTWKRIRADNEAALKGQSGWSTPYKSTNRILVGPMKSAAAARELVKKLAKGGVAAMTFQSEAGEEVVKIAVR